jgi:hypothetical protein
MVVVDDVKHRSHSSLSWKADFRLANSKTSLLVWNVNVYFTLQYQAILMICKGTSWMLELTNSMEQSPSWEAKKFLPTPEMFYILGNPKVHCRVYKSPPVTLYWTRLIQSTSHNFISLRSFSILSSQINVVVSFFWTELGSWNSVCSLHFQ